MAVMPMCEASMLKEFNCGGHSEARRTRRPRAVEGGIVIMGPACHADEGGVHVMPANQTFSIVNTVEFFKT